MTESNPPVTDRINTVLVAPAAQALADLQARTGLEGTAGRVGTAAAQAVNLLREAIGLSPGHDRPRSGDPAVTNMMADDEQADGPQGYDLVMPFVSVTSKGGPYDDSAYCAGWAMGVLDTRLSMLGPLDLSETVRTDDLAQADLIAMAHGYRMDQRASEVEGWTFVEFIRQPVDAP